MIDTPASNPALSMKPPQDVTEDRGWFICKSTYRFQRRLWKRYGIMLGYGEYSRLVKQAQVDPSTPDARKLNGMRRVATVTLDSGMKLDIVLTYRHIFGLADEMAEVAKEVFIPKKLVRLSQSLYAKYGITLTTAMMHSIRDQVAASQDNPVLSLAHDRAIHRVELGEHREVYILARKLKVLEAKRDEGVRRGIAARLLEQADSEPA